MQSFTTVLTLAALVGTSLAYPQVPKGSTNGTKGGLKGVDQLLDNIVIPPGPAPEGCAKYEVLLARGTSEFGPFGFIVGDPLVNNVKKALPDARGYAVDYPANSGKNSLETGAANLQARLKKKSAECPDMKYALSGYSQGASVVRAAFQNWTDTTIQDKIVAIVLFGDPGLNQQDYNAKKGVDPSLSPFPLSLYGRLREYCNKGDPVCSVGTNFIAHIGYSATNIAQSASNFIVQAFKGTPLPAQVDGAI